MPTVNDIKRNFKNDSGIPMNKFINSLDKQFNLFDSKKEKWQVVEQLRNELLDTLVIVETIRMWPVLVEINKKLTRINRDEAIVLQVFAKRLCDLFIEKKGDLIIDKQKFIDGWTDLFEHYIISLNEVNVRQRHIQK